MTKIEELQARIHELHKQLDQEYEHMHDEYVRHRVEFADRFLALQKRHRIGLLRYLRHSRVLVVLSAPLVYLGWFPFMLPDVFVTLFQLVCFPLYGIPKVRRSTYFVFDRADLPYLNLIEKFNCFYCSYGNGVAAYAREISARTEQYWCPIKHARRLKGAHRNHSTFFEHNDGEAYRKGLERLRKQYSQD